MNRSGREAEEQMAHYLRRAFGTSKDVIVFNGLRIESDGDAAQMDHLVLHRCGAIVVETKSVTGRVKINERGEWTRFVGQTAKGMGSPIEQAIRQAEFLKSYLRPHAAEILRRMVGLQIQFTHIPIDILVAISDGGIVDAPKKRPLPEVCKSDQIPSRIKEFIARYKKANSLFTPSLNPFDTRDVWHSMNDDELDRFRDFLLANHRPLVQRPASTARGSGQPSRGLQAAEAGEPGALSIVPRVCAECGKPLTDKVIAYCQEHAKKFDGRLFCFQHQRISNLAS